MVKCESIGMIEVGKNNPIIQSQTDVKNYSFIEDDGDLYLISNVISGDKAYVDDTVIPAGEYLNGFLVKAWEGQKLVIDGKHVTGGIAEVEKDAILTVAEDGSLEVAEEAPESGVYFKVTDTGIVLTEAAVKAKVVIA